MKVSWLLPWRTTQIFPSELTSMIVAPFPIVSGAADIALLIISSSVIFRKAYCAVGQLPILKRGHRTPQCQRNVSHETIS